MVSTPHPPILGETFQTFLKKEMVEKIMYFRGNLTFRGNLDDFIDTISFTYYKLYDNKYLSLLNQLKMCSFRSKLLHEMDMFK